jgi:hypothetical protein
MCSAVERCVWRVGPRDALARAYTGRDVRGQRQLIDLIDLHTARTASTAASTPTSMPMHGARRLQASSSSLGRLRWGHECSGADATHQHSALATRSIRPNFHTTLAGQTAS